MIWLLRHGDAEQGDGDDSARRLTAKGERQSAVAGRALGALGVGLDLCLSSPKLRALDTATIACEGLGVSIEVEDRLRGGSFDAPELCAGRGEVLLVGHEPDFSDAIAAVTGARVKLKKGGLAAIEDGVLQALLRPKDLSAIARR